MFYEKYDMDIPLCTIVRQLWEREDPLTKGGGVEEVTLVRQDTLDGYLTIVAYMISDTLEYML